MFLLLYMNLKLLASAVLQLPAGAQYSPVAGEGFVGLEIVPDILWWIYMFLDFLERLQVGSNLSDGAISRKWPFWVKIGEGGYSGTRSNIFLSLGPCYLDNRQQFLSYESFP